MTRKDSVLLKQNGKDTTIQAMVCKPTLETHPTTGKKVLCGYIRRNGRHIRVHYKPGIVDFVDWVSTWDYPNNEETTEETTAPKIIKTTSINAQMTQGFVQSKPIITVICLVIIVMAILTLGLTGTTYANMQTLPVCEVEQHNVSIGFASHRLVEKSENQPIFSDISGTRYEQTDSYYMLSLDGETWSILKTETTFCR